MPKKIVLKIRQDRPQEPVEMEPAPQQAEELPAVLEPEQPATEPQPATPSSGLEEALKEYEELMKELDLIRNLDKNVIAYCIKLDDLRPQLVRSIVGRLSEKRTAVLKKSTAVLEKMKAARDSLGSEFAGVEEELIWSSIELNTMQLEGGKADSSRVGLKEELEARIPELRKKLTTLRNRLKMVEDVIKNLSELPRNIVELTSSKEDIAKLFEDAKKRYMITHGQRAEAVLRAEIDRVAQQEAIPREYATLLVWKAAVQR
ncbi:MAG: hypothetical protein NZ919_01090 [Candidatus Caldarchaeum sp.]|nr:hypothetical protein [Candidatus Caldarchaeum sp.]